MSSTQVGPITVRSTCSHHFVPVIGRMWVGVLPGKSVIGISKVVRVANWIVARPHSKRKLMLFWQTSWSAALIRRDWPSSLRCGTSG
ncbi:GTP cyclohydrolase I [Bradyrhizobium sp. 139]|nr:GTP cyclohydrolase I [Bradyrhizobium sp. 139]